ncbi:MAG: acetylpolyamine aminohydrolase [Desulfobacca sp.]|nr:acetylpolyamine aminohydrolase [Desulfobacca sp.]
MKVVYHPDFIQVYTSDPAAEAGRMEAIWTVVQDQVERIEASPATREQIDLAHSPEHIAQVTRRGLYDIASLAAGGAIQAARIGLREPAFALIRPPGHHASADHSWGFCYFNNMAIALLTLHNEGLISQTLVLDIDLHFGDGTVNILGNEEWARIYNPAARSREAFLTAVEEILSDIQVDLIGISAGFDYHREDWGGLLTTEDYATIGSMTRKASLACGAGCFAVLEGGYNHQVLGQNVAALLEGMAG